MPDTMRRVDTETVLVCDEQGPPVRGEQDALDLVGLTFSLGENDDPVTWVLLPTTRLENEFFQLSTGIAGAVLQKLTQYRLGVAVVGDVSRHTAVSSAFHDFVVESNRGSQLWFLTTAEEFEDRIVALRSRRPAR